MTELTQAIQNIRATLNIQDRRGNPNAAFLLSRLPRITSGKFEDMLQQEIRRGA